jgi:hypothetical protein
VLVLPLFLPPQKYSVSYTVQLTARNNFSPERILASIIGVDIHALLCYISPCLPNPSNAAFSMTAIQGSTTIDHRTRSSSIGVLENGELPSDCALFCYVTTYTVRVRTNDIYSLINSAKDV